MAQDCERKKYLERYPCVPWNLTYDNDDIADKWGTSGIVNKWHYDNDHPLSLKYIFPLMT